MTSRRLSLRKRPADAAPAPVDPAPGSSDAAPAGLGKGRPTPKRREAQKRRGPVAPPPATRREAAARSRAEARAGRSGSRVVDGPRLLARDAGPVRALVRDLVDRRRNVAVLMLPLALAVLLVRLADRPLLTELVTRIWTLTLFLVIADLVVLAIVLRRAVRAAYPDETRLRGHIGYGVMRSTTIRRLRMPSARVRPAGLFGR